MNSYDTLPYPGLPYRQTHPDRLRTIARLLGMDPPSAERCRVLELGCGDGGNLLPMAWALPHSKFVGLDLGAAHIRQGQAKVRQLGLINLELRQQDLMEFGPHEGEFDYILAYGLYSWVPPQVADRILDIMSRHLSARGIGYVNYTAYPGGRLRESVRDLMLFAARGIAEPAERLQRARTMLEAVAGARAADDEFGALLQAEARRVAARESPFVFHDELAEAFHPVYVHEFAAQAARHGLQYLAEATLSDSHTAAVSIGDDFIDREQYLDFIQGRAFRHTLLCRTAIALDHQLRTDVLPQLFAASNAAAVEAGGAMVEFRGPRSSLKTDHPVVQAVLRTLAQAWPRSVRVAALPEQIGRSHAAVIAQVLLSAFSRDLVEIYSTPPLVASEPGHRPEATPLARLQAQQGEKISTLVHTYIAVEDDLARHLIGLLDGTRDRAALMAELAPRAPGMSRDQLGQQIDDYLAALCRWAVLRP